MSLIAFLAVAALAGQEPAPVSRGCLDDNGADRCVAENRARILADMGAPAIEAEAAAGVEAYRVLQVDGYGNDQPVVAFERRPGASPRVAVYGRDGQVGLEPPGPELDPPELDGRTVPARPLNPGERT